MQVHVAHRVGSWLPLTQTWVDSQIRFLPAFVSSSVLCERRLNADNFSLDHGHVLRERVVYRLTRVLSKKLARHVGLSLDKSFCTDKSIQILHSHFGDHAWSGLPLARVLRVPHVVTFYGYDLSRLPHERPIWRERYRQLFQSADLFLCEGEHMARCLRELGAPDNKVAVHHLGVDLTQFSYAPRTWSPDQPLRILMAASFREKKGIPFGIAAINRLAGRIPMELTLIGDAGKDEASRKEKLRILDALAKLDHRIQVNRFGYVSHAQLHEIAANQHVFLVPSVTAADGDTEGGAPVAAIEMLASGMPVIGTRHCDIPGIMPAEMAVLLAPERDVGALATAISAWIDQHADWRRLLDAARKHVECNFDAEAQGQRLAAIYRSLVDRSYSTML